jgi:hypothetical protein
VNFATLSPALALALAAATALLVVAVYLLRPPPQRVRVASTLLWERVAASRRRVSQRWRWWLSLLLALLIALGLALAIAGPESDVAPGERRELLLVVDNSPSMGAWRSDGRTRLDHALEAARSEIDAAPPGARFHVADTMRSVSSAGLVDAQTARATLVRIGAGQGGQPVFPDLSLLPVGASGRELVFVTDGVHPMPLPGGVRRVSVFESGPNLGITAFSIRALATDATRHEAFVEIANAGASAVDAMVTISGPGRSAQRRGVRVPGRGFAAVTLNVSDFGGGALRAAVEADDDRLELDDVAYAFLPLNRVLRVGLVTPGNAALERALRLDPRVRLTVMAPSRYGRGGSFDAWVFDRFTPSAAPLAPVLVLRPGEAGWITPASRPLAAPAVASWLPDQPVLDNVSLADVQLDRAAALRIADQPVEVLARSADGQALVTASTRAPRWVATGFAIDDTNFAAQASFPVFLANAMQWLTEDNPVRAEGVGLVRAPLAAARASGMSAGALAARAVPGGTLLSVPAPDFVTLEASGERLRMLVNVLDPAVTDINASDLPPGPDGAARSRVAQQPGGLPAWWWIALVALLLLVAEWVTFHRRWTV